MADSAQATLRNAIQQGLTLCLDTNCLLYYFGGEQPWQQNLHPIFEARDQGKIQLITSSVTLAEVLAQAQNPAQENQLLNTIRRYFDIVPVSDQTGIDAARIRQSSRVRTPDALEMATATSTSATLFITNDEQLIRAPLQGAQPLYLKDLALDWLEDEFDACLDISQPPVTLPPGQTTLSLDLVINSNHPLSPLQIPIPATEFPLLGLKLSQMVAGPTAVIGLVETSSAGLDQLHAIGLLPTGRPWIMPGFPNWVQQYITKARHDWHEHEPDDFARTLLEQVRRQNQSKEGRGEPERYTLYLLADVSRLVAEEAVNNMDGAGNMLPHRKRAELWRRYLAPFFPLSRLWNIDGVHLWRGEASNAHKLNITQFHSFFDQAQAVLGGF